MKSKFIVIEGNEGVGKSSQIESIKDYLEQHNVDFVLTREPGGTEIGDKLRGIILNENYQTEPTTDALMFYASRFENFSKIILPALENNKTVLCDRFHYSTYIYQGVIEKNDLVKKIHNIFDKIFSSKIDHIIYFYTSPDESYKRISRRANTDKFESKGLEYLKSLNKAYEELFSKLDNVIKIDTSKDKIITKEVLYRELDKIFQNDK